MIIISITNNKGGVGKTAMVKNLAFALSKQNKTVAVIDQDNQQNLTNSYYDDLGFDLITTDKSNDQLQQIAQNDEYDFILIDTPPNLGTETVSSYLISDFILIPVTLGLNSVEGMVRTIQSIDEVKLHNPKLQFLGAVVNGYDKRDRECDSHLRQLKETLGNKLLKTIIRVSQNIKNADDRKQSVQDYESKNWIKKSTEDYQNLAKEILKLTK